MLAIDTCLDACSAALVEGDRVRSEISEPMQRGQAERLAPLISELFEAAHAAPADIDRIVVTRGPGSFTGLRIGLAYARGLALALNKPCIGISTLEALALSDGEAGLRGAIVATPSALYGAFYKDGRAILEPSALEPEEASDAFRRAANGRGFTLAGPGAAAWAPRVSASALATQTPNVVALAKLGARRDPASHAPDPLYLRTALR